MSYGIALYNNNDRAVIASDSVGYEYHSSQNQTNVFSSTSGTASITGVWETYRVTTGDSVPPIVFITDLGAIPEPNTGVTLVDTAKMVSISAINLASSGVWDVVIRRGHDKVSSATNPITFLFFTPLPSYTSVGYSLVTYNSSGNPSYDSSRKMLMPRVFGTFGGSVPANSIRYVNIANYAAILSALNITRPAFMISGNFTDRETQSVGYNIYCTAFHHTLFTLYSEGPAMFYGRNGHNSDNTANADTCASGSAPDTLGTVNTTTAFSYLIIDADDY